MGGKLLLCSNNSVVHYKFGSIAGIHISTARIFLHDNILFEFLIAGTPFGDKQKPNFLAPQSLDFGFLWKGHYEVKRKYKFMMMIITMMMMMTMKVVLLL